MRLDDELRFIKDSLKNSDSRNKFDIQVEPAVTISHIRRALLENKPEIVHFCGHGAGNDGIVCKDELGQIKRVPTTALSNLFELSNDHVRCVVLNACFAEIQANEIVKHIDFVVGMKYEIGDEAALRFAQGFYDALFAGKEFADCFAFGVNAIQLENIPEDLTPIIKIRDKRKGLAPKKTIKARPKKSPTSTADTKAGKTFADATDSATPLNSHTSQPMAVDTQQHIQKKGASTVQISKKLFVAILLISLFAIAMSSIAISMQRKRDDLPANPVVHEMVGVYRQEIEQGKPDEVGKPNPQIRSHEVQTLLYVFFDPGTKQLRATELTFWKIYYVPDEHPEKRFLIGAYLADWRITEIDSTGTPIKMRGASSSRPGLEIESKVGEQPLNKNILNELEGNIRGLNERFRSAYFEMSLEAGGKLVRYKWYNDDEKIPGKAGIKETFIRQ